MNIRKNASRGDGDASEKLVEFLIVADSQLNVTWDYPCTLVIPCCIASKLKNLSCKVFEHGCKVDRCSCADALGVSTLAKIAGNAADGELKSCLGALCSARASMLAATAFTFTTSAMRRTQDLILIGRTGKLDFEGRGAMHVSCSI